VDEDEITAKIVELASAYGRYGYRMITVMLRGRGYRINHKRVYRIWRSLGLKVLAKQPKRRRLWLNDGSCIRLRAEHPNHLWSYDFVESRTGKEQKIKTQDIVYEYARERPSGRAALRIRPEDLLREVMVRKGPPEYLRSDNGS
jgi:hypothetical protein